MRHSRPVLALVLLISAWSIHSAASQQAAAPAPLTLTDEQMEGFLLNARIVERRGTGRGINNTQRVTLTDGRITHDAQLQIVDVSLSVFKPPTGPPEMNFRDSYRYNIAAYRVARLLDLDNVPMSVERNIDGKRGSMTWWVDDVAMVEGERLKKQVSDPDRERTAMQLHVMRVFDELIANRDRNIGNMLWTSTWKMWMIDHTRAFRLSMEPLKPELLERVERSLYQNLQALTAASITKATGTTLTTFEVRAMISRRDAIVRHFESRIKQRGEGSVLYVARP
jgi:hypothetical protein